MESLSQNYEYRNNPEKFTHADIQVLLFSAMQSNKMTRKSASKSILKTFTHIDVHVLYFSAMHANKMIL